MELGRMTPKQWCKWFIIRQYFINMDLTKPLYMPDAVWQAFIELHIWIA